MSSERQVTDELSAELYQAPLPHLNDRLGEFLTSLISCALERCEHGEPALFRFEVGRLAYLTLGYSPRDELGDLLTRVNLDEESQGALLAQLERVLSSDSPSWLDRSQLRVLILGVVRLIQASWRDREELIREVCHIFSLSPRELLTPHLSNVATLAPHLWVMLESRARRRQNASKMNLHWAPLPPEYTGLRTLDYQEGYWQILTRRRGQTVCLEFIRGSASLLTGIDDKVSGWQPYHRSGVCDAWVWAERPAHLDLSMITESRQRMSAEQAVLLCLPILRALSALHRTQRVCGLLTPRQILIDVDCHAQLADRLRWHPRAATQLNARWRVDEVMYWSPERFERDASPSPQSDMWAFGLILYQLLCGELPWQESRTLADLMTALRQPDLDQMLKRSPMTLRSFLSRCLERELDQRWSHATQALEALSEVAEQISPLLQGQRLIEQWRALMEVDGPQRFIEEMPIIPTQRPAEELARFVQSRVNLYDLASPHIDPVALEVLFPRLTELHKRWWTHHAALQDSRAQYESSMTSFRSALTEIAPEFLFEQLTLLSQQKETLEIRYQERSEELKRYQVLVKDEVRSHTLEALRALWKTLGLSPDLIPNLSLEEAAQRGEKRRAQAQLLGELEAPRPLSTPQALFAPQEIQIVDLEVDEASEDSQGPPAEGPPAEPPQDSQPLESALELVQSESSLIIKEAEEVLREQIFSTPPEERLERLSEFGAMKREIELSQPVSSFPVPLSDDDLSDQSHSGWSISPTPFDSPQLADLIELSDVEVDADSDLPHPEAGQVSKPQDLQESDEVQ